MTGAAADTFSGHSLVINPRPQRTGRTIRLVTGGTVALLFSDIEGSTRLLQQLGPDYAGVLVEHRRLLRAAFAEHSGTEQSTEGDSFFVTFPSASDAVAAAADGQLALSTYPWPEGAPVRVRMGLHVGVIQAVADTIVGMAVHEAARICAAGHGGQVLASDDVVRDADVADIGWDSIGEHQLKDLPAPMRLHQLVHPALPQQFQPVRSEGGARANLPSQPTAFVGRSGDIAHVRELLAGTRLLTVTGTGGVGKSRIALRVASDLVADFADGVWFVDLASVADPGGVVAAVAASLGVQASTLDDLATALGERRMLVLIDNCEHLIAAVGDVVASLVQRCPRVTVLATSREPLGMLGEVVWRVPPLAVADAVELLTARAQAVNASFVVTDANRAAVEAVCQRLDAIPLALELAAARLTTLSVEQLEARLDQRFRLLSGGLRGGLERHRTLQATVDWSYNLLATDEQSVLRRTGVFAGSFPLAAVEAVAPELDPIDVIDVVERLVRKSLLLADSGASGEPRWRLLETVRQYAVDQLVRADEVVSVRDAHLQWVVSLMTSAARTLWLGGDETAWLTRLDAEDGNIRNAVGWALDTGAVEDACTIVFAGVGWFVSRGRSAEGVSLAASVFAAEPSGVGEALLAVAEMSMASGCGRLTPAMVDRVRRTAPRLAGTSWDWARPIALAHTSAWSYASGDVAGAGRAIPLCASYVEEARAFGPGATGWALQTLFWACLDAGDASGARAAASSALECAVEARLSMLESRMAFNRARIALVDEEWSAAWSFAEQAVRVARGTGESFVVAAATQLMADVAVGRGDLALARDLLASAVDHVAESMTQADVDAVVARLASLPA